MLEQLTAYTHFTLEEMQNHEEILFNAFDKEHRILFWNRKCEQLFGIGKEAALGRKLEDVLPFTKGHDKMVHLQRALMGQEVHILKDRYETRHGYYEQRVIPVKDAGGTVIAALNIVYDLS